MSVPSLKVYQNGVSQASGDDLNTFLQGAVSVTNLRAFIGVSGMTVSLQGFTAPNDGGQGTFYWNSTGTGPDDGGVTNIVPNGAAIGCWTRIPIGSSSFSAVAPFYPVVHPSSGNIQGSGSPIAHGLVWANSNPIFAADTLVVNSTDPSALIQIVLSGSVTTGDTITLHFIFSGHNYTAAYTAIGGDTLTTMAAGLIAAIKANANLYVPVSATNIGGGGLPGQILYATNVGATLDLDYDVRTTMTMTASVSGAATEVVTLPNGGSPLPTALDANVVLGLTRNAGVAPSAGSNIGQILFGSTKSTAPTSITVQYCSIIATVLNSTSGSLSAQLLLGTCNPTTGGIDRGLYIGAGAYTVGATGGASGDMGYNTFNTGAYYRDGVDIRSTSPGAIGAASGATITGAFIASGIITRNTQAVATDTTDTAVNIIAAVTETLQAGITLDLLLINQMAGTWTINAGVGVAYNTGTGTLTVPTGTSRLVKVRLTNTTNSVTIYG